MTPHTKTASERIADLEHDNAQLYMLLGALTDAVEQLGPIGQQQIKKILISKRDNASPEHHDALATLIEAMFNE